MGDTALYSSDAKATGATGGTHNGPGRPLSGKKKKERALCKIEGLYINIRDIRVIG